MMCAGFFLQWSCLILVKYQMLACKFHFIFTVLPLRTYLIFSCTIVLYFLWRSKALAMTAGSPDRIARYDISIPSILLVLEKGQWKTLEFKPKVFSQMFCLWCNFCSAKQNNYCTLINADEGSIGLESTGWET